MRLSVLALSQVLLCLAGCKTVGSTLAEAPSCSDASLLERVASIVVPAGIPAARRDCIQKSFQAELDLEKTQTKDKAANDRYNAGELNTYSSLIKDYAFTQANIFDRKAYIKGPANFGAHRRLIAAAQEEVLLQTYVWESVSTSAQEIMNGLQDLQQNRRKACPSCPPIVVRIVANYGPTALDAIGAITGGERVVDYGADARTAIAALNFDPKILDIRVLTYTHRAFGTNHVKSLIVDGQIAMVTGANAQRFNDEDVNWYDVGYMMGGDVAKGLRRDLINNLIRATTGAEKDGDESLAQGLGTPYNRVFTSTYPIRQMMADPFEDPAGIPAIITSRHGFELPSQNNNTTANRGFQAAFQGARKSIRLQTPNFNDDGAVRALGAAARRGVRIEMIQSKLFNCKSENQVGQGGQNEKGISRFLREFSATAPQGTNHDLRWFAMQKDGQNVTVFDNPSGKKPEERPNNSHAKFATVDDELVIVGSSNMDTQSWNQSRELNIMVFHPVITTAWQLQVFAANFAIAQPISADELQDAAIKCE